MANPHVQGFFDEATNTVSYIVSDPATKSAAIIDPVLDFDFAEASTATHSASRLLRAVEEQGLSLRWVLETHAHADHLTAAKVIAKATGAKIGIGEHIRRVQTAFAPLFGVSDEEAASSVFDKLFRDGDEVQLGELTIKVLHTPGHTPACLTYLIGDAAFVGDTLFMPDYGTARSDFPGGDARTLFRSIQKILALPDETRVFVGHDYLPQGRTDYRWETTVREQRAHNIHIGAGKSEDDFVRMREERDSTLRAPKLILPSLQVNIRGGSMPQPEEDGRIYLKLPINALGEEEKA